MVELKTVEAKTEVNAESIKKLYNIGYRNFIATDYVEAADALQEVCRWNAQTHGEKGDACADALLLYGRCLLELGRAENCVLGNALKGFHSLEYDSQEELPSTEQFEDADKVTEVEREKLRTDVTEAMAENDTIDEETEEEKDDKKDEKMAEDEKPAEEAKTEAKKEEEKTEEKMEMEVEKDDKEEKKPEEQDSIAEDPDAIPSLQLAWEMIELSRVIYKAREESNERDIKISECYLRLGEIGLENEQYSSAVGDLLECQMLQKARFDANDRRIAETHYHLGVAYSFEKRPNNAQEHFKSARDIIDAKIDALTEQFDAESEKDKSDEKLMSDLTNEIAQLKDILPDLNSKLEDMDAMINQKGTSKVQEHLDTSKSETTGNVQDIQHLVKRKQEEKEKMEQAEKKQKLDV